MLIIIVVVVVGGDGDIIIIIMRCNIISIGSTGLLLAQNCPATWGSALPVFVSPRGHFISITVRGKARECVD